MLPVPKHDHWPPERLQPGFNPRTDLTRDDEFDGSIKAYGVQNPVWARENGSIIAGNRRVEAAKRVGLKTIPVLVYPADITEAQIIGLTMIENLQRKDLTPEETRIGLKQFKAVCPEMPQKDIAKAVGLSEGMVSQFFALDKLCPEAMAAFKDGKIGVTKAYKVATSDDQPAKLAFFLNGGTREEGERKTRKQKPVAPNDLAKRIALPPVGKAAVTIAAGKSEEISLDDALDAVQEAARQIKAAQSKGISAATAARYFKDIAAAG